MYACMYVCMYVCIEALEFDGLFKTTGLTFGVHLED